MFLKKVLNQPNLVGSMLIALMVCGGFVYAVGFNGFSVETATGGEVEAWLAAADGGSSGVIAVPVEVRAVLQLKETLAVIVPM